MREKGKISKWIDEKGYGFITSDNGQQIFVHIKSFKKVRKNPTVGDVVTYEIAHDVIKGPQAYNIQYPEQKITHSVRKRQPKKEKRNYKLLFVPIIAAALFFVWQKFKLPADKPVLEEQPITATEPAAKFQCSGKKRCSEMLSCEEATFYLKNCPGTIADGDGDGTPCEDQWCGH